MALPLYLLAFVISLLWSGLQLLFLNERFSGVEGMLSDTLSLGLPILLMQSLSVLVMQFARPARKRISLLFAWAAGGSALILLLYRNLRPALPFPEVRIMEIQSNAEVFIAAALLALQSMFLLWCWIHFNQKEAEEQVQRKKETEQLARQAELSGLRLQLQPHFLFNSLNAVYGLMQSNSEKAGEMLLLLSDFFRSVVNRSEKELIAFQEEWHSLNLYLQIEQIRFADRLQLRINTAPSIELMKIPALILQPLAENAIKYGLYGKTGKVEIGITIHLEGTYMQIEMDNPMPDTTHALPEGTGFGQHAIRRRLLLHYGRSDLFETRIENDRYFVILRIPQPLNYENPHRG